MNSVRFETIILDADAASQTVHIRTLESKVCRLKWGFGDTHPVLLHFRALA